MNLSSDKKTDGPVEGSESVRTQAGKSGECDGADEKYRLLFERMLNGFAYHKIVTDDAGKPVDYVFLDVNPAFCEMTHLKKEDVIGRKVSEILPGTPNDSADWVGRYGRVALGGGDERFEDFSQDMGRWFSVYAYSPERGYFATVFEDITEIRTALDTAEKEREKFQQVFDGSGDALMLLDREKFLDANQATLELFGCRDKGEFVGKHPADVSPPLQADGTPSRAAADKRIDNAYNEGRYFFEWTHRRIDGTDFPASVLFTPLELDGKTVLQATVRDMTEQKDAEEKIVALSRLKSRFISAVTNAARGPLEKIKWSLEGLKTVNPGKLTDEELNLIQHAIDQDNELLKVIENMNLVLEIEREVVVYNRVLVSPVTVVKSVELWFRDLVSTKNIDWQETVSDGRIGSVEVDVEKLRHGIGTIIDNARRYLKSKQGTIRVTMEQRDKEFYCSIEDDGIGIPEAEQPYVFERFFRASNAQAKHAEGMGLGLYIARAIFEDQGGKIGFESEEGRGTKFWFTLPIVD